MTFAGLSRADVFSLSFLLVLAVAAILAPWILSYDFSSQSMDVLVEPSFDHWFGTDSLGRDLFARVIYGTRVSLFIGFTSAIISVLFGVVIGGFSGWTGGLTDRVLMKIVDVLISIPTMVVLILFSLIFSSWEFWPSSHMRSLVAIVISLTFVSWMGIARVVRNQVIQAKQNAFVEASKALGASPFRLFSHHVLPHIAGPVVVLFTFQVPYNILFESFLSFIGLGLQPPYASWGVLAGEGWKMLQVYPHLVIFPGVAIFLTSLTFNILGDSLQDQTLNRKSRTSPS